MKDFLRALAPHKKLIFQISIIALSLFSFFMFLTSFGVSFYRSDAPGGVNFTVGSHLNFDVASFTYPEDIAIVLVVFIFMIFGIGGILLSIASFFSKREDDLCRANLGNTIMNFTFSAIFFVAGYAYCMIYNNQNPNLAYRSDAQVPFILTAFVLVFQAIIVTLYRRDYIPLLDERGNLIKREVRQKKPHDFEGLLYTGLVTLISLVSLGINYLVINVSLTIPPSAPSEQEVILNSIEILQNYNATPPNATNQIIAFILILFYVACGLLLITVVAAYFAKLERYHAYVEAAVLGNVSMIFLLAMTGLYFSIAQEMNRSYLEAIIQQYAPGVDLGAITYEYDIRSDYVYLFVLEFIVLIVCLVRRVFRNPKKLALAGAGAPVQEGFGRENPFAPGPKKRDEVDALNDLNKTLDKFQKDVKDQQKENFQSLADSLDNISGSIRVANATEEEANRNVTTDPCESFTELENKRQFFAEDLEERKKTSKAPFSLKGLVQFVVEYAKDSPNHLSYTRETIACFVSGLGFSRLSILQGMSGTGKTSLPKIFAEAIGGECRILEVESSWKDKNELIGYYNQFSRKFIPTKFTNALYEASLNPEIPYLLVLDEMNLSRIEYYFSDFLSLMENDPDHRVLNLVNVPLVRLWQGQRVDYASLKENQFLPIPKNVWFVGTANNDESTFEISDKVYDRANTMDFDKRAKKIRDFSQPIPSQFVSSPYLTKLLDEAVQRKSFDAENDPTIQRVEALLSPYNISFGNRILKQIEQFVTLYNACFEEDRTFEAVESILLTKVVCKLRNKIVENKDALEEKFEELKLLRCAEFISRLNED